MCPHPCAAAAVAVAVVMVGGQLGLLMVMQRCCISAGWRQEPTGFV